MKGKLRMKKYFVTLMLLAISSSSFSVYSGEIDNNNITTFTSGAVISSTDVNAAVAEVIAQINDNHSRITILENPGLVFSSVMVGTWEIENKNIGDGHSASGKITILDDGTFDLTEGSFAAIGEGSGVNGSFCDNTDGTEKYTVITNDVLLFEHDNQGLATNAVIPKVVLLENNKIILVGSGGCGKGGTQRVSILSRIGV